MIKKRVISIDLNTETLSNTVEHIIDLAAERTSSYVCVCNVHMLVEAYNDKSFAGVVNNSDIAVADGMPLCWSLKWLHGIQAERIAGRHLMHAIMEKASEENTSVYFYGSTDEVLNNSKIYINSHYPKLTVAGVYSPPYRALSNEEEENVVKMIADSGAGIVFVALGCPKQEKWIAKMRGRIPAVMLGIGIALEVLTGQQKRTPAWIEKAGLEWLFRLLKEPKRLFKRYLITNSTFIFLIIKALILKTKTNKG